ncbi:MAG: hypothetical protein F4Y88_06085 [Chloroflexi bacterium]|nr:hypothetical protein [Chloroflexota bacterium]
MGGRHEGNVLRVVKPSHVTVEVDGDELVVIQPNLTTNRRARMMFGSMLGSRPITDGWRCFPRQGTTDDLAVRIHTFLEREGWSVILTGSARTAVERAVERKRSFQRTHQAAEEFRSGHSPLRVAQVLETLADFGWDGTRRRLLDHQERGVLHGLTAVNAANFSVPGSGKTATTLAIAAAHFQANTVELLVVVGPLACFQPWEAEAAAALNGIIETRRVRGNRRQRHEIYQSVQPRQVLLLSYATSASDRLRLTELCDSFKTMLVVDESHRIKRFNGGVWAPALHEIARHARVRIILSGTPMPHSGRDLYSQLNVLWPAAELTGPRDRFAADAERDFGQVLLRIQPFMLRTPKEALGLRPYEVIWHDADLQDTQKDIYDLIASGFRRRIEQADDWTDKIDSLRRGRPIRLLQAATNPDTLNGSDRQYRLPKLENPNPTLMERLATYEERETPAKFKVALGIIGPIIEGGGKVVCWSNFISNLDQFAAHVRNRISVPVFQVDGRLPVGDEAEYDSPDPVGQRPREIETRERIITRFLRVKGPAVLITNPASCSESISLHHGCHNAIYLDRTYDCALFLQSIDRIHRLGLSSDANVSIHIIRSTIDGLPTIDHLVEASLLRKEEKMRRLLEGAELAPLGQDADPLTEADGDDHDLEALMRYLLGEEAPLE